MKKKYGTSINILAKIINRSTKISNLFFVCDKPFNRNLLSDSNRMVKDKFKKVSQEIVWVAHATIFLLKMINEKNLFAVQRCC